MPIHPQIQQWQDSRHEIGIIEFSDGNAAARRFHHSVPAGFTPIGQSEAELLCVEESTGEIVELEHEVANHVACRCAASQEQFVAALLVLEEYYRQCSENDDIWYDQAAGLAAVTRAAEAAGGSRYAPMYHSMVCF